MTTFVRALTNPQGSLVSPIADGGASPAANNARERTIGPFTIVARFDATFAPGAAPLDVDVRPHPHIGIATLTYLFDGAITHRDGRGNVVEILPGDVAWMIAGRGVVHSERIPTLRAHGGRFHGLQIWVALRDGHEDCEPSFEIVRAADVVVAEASGVRVRTLVGGSRPRAPSAAFGDFWMCDVAIARGAAYAVPSAKEAAIHVIAGALEIDERTLAAGETAIFAEGDARRVVAHETAHAIAFGGDPIGPRYLWWNYLHSSKERIERAKAEWRDKTFALPADDRDDVIPLPADHERPLRLLNPG